MTFTLKRTTAAGILTVMGATTLVGCGIGDKPGEAASGDESDGSIDVVWKGDADRAASIQEALDLFNESHPDVTITTDYQSGSEYMQKMSIRFASGDAPDLMRQERETLRDYSDRGTLLDLNEVSDVLDLSALSETVRDAGVVDGKQFGVPGGITSFSYAIRADILEKYGVEVPNMESWSWDDLLEVAAEVTEASGGEVWGTEIPVGEISNLGIWLRQHGEDLWDADGNPAFTAETVQAWFDMYLEAVEMGAQPAADELDQLGAAADQSTLGQGLVAINSIPTNSFAVFNDVSGGGLEMGYYPGESQAEQRGQQVIPSLYWSISASSADPTAAAEVLDFLINDPEGAAMIGSTHGQPANPDVSAAMADDLTPDDKVAFDEILDLSELDLAAPVPDPAGSASLRDELASIADQVKFGQITSAEGAEQFVEVAESTLGAS